MATHQASEEAVPAQQRPYLGKNNWHYSRTILAARWFPEVTSPLDSHPMGQTSTTQGTKSGGLSCLAQKLGSTSTPCPSSGRTHVTSCLASPGPHTAEHSPTSDACHLWTRGKWLSKTLEVSRCFFFFSNFTRCDSLLCGSARLYLAGQWCGLHLSTASGAAPDGQWECGTLSSLSPCSRTHLTGRTFSPPPQEALQGPNGPASHLGQESKFMLLSHSQCVFFDRRAAPH